MAVIVLLFTFGRSSAMGLPIVTAILGLVTGLSIVTLLSHVIEVPTVAPTLATMIGLGVGIDYALFIVTRHRAQVAEEGMDYRESVAACHRDVGRRGRVRRLDGDGRAAVAGDRRSAARHGARYTSAIVVLVAVIAAINAPAGAARPSRAAHREAAAAAAQAMAPRQQAARLAPLGEVREQAPVAVADHRGRDPHGARAAGDEAVARPAGQRVAARGHPRRASPTTS